MKRRVLITRTAFGLALVSASASLLVLGPRAIARADDKPAVKLNFPYLDAGRPDSPTGSIVITKTPPDPAPMTERAQWIFDLRWDKGDLYLLGVHALDLSAPQATPRAMGRFALELFEGPTVIERVRFDFPLMGAGEVLDAGRKAPPSFERKLTTRIGVMFPASRRGTKLELWDRATGARWTMPWPVAMPTTNDAGPSRDATTEGG